LSTLSGMPASNNLTSAAALEALKTELEQLEGDGRRAIAERIRTAREWGDLKENSEYHDAKNDQAHLETRIARLRERIAGAVVADETAAAAGTVGFGSTVLIREEDGSERAWTIVSSRDASPSNGRLSADSPVAVALMGRTAGERVAVALPRGKRTMTVVRVS
jgi:transcription elongation factor GreA